MVNLTDDKKKANWENTRLPFSSMRLAEVQKFGNTERLTCWENKHLHISLEGSVLSSIKNINTPTLWSNQCPSRKVSHWWICTCVYKVRRRQWHPTPVLLPGKSHGQRSLVGCTPWGRKESDTTKRLHFHFSLSCIGEGNGNPLQCSCLENPRDGGAWWAAVYGVAQRRARLKWLSSSSSSSI